MLLNKSKTVRALLLLVVFPLITSSQNLIEVNEKKLGTKRKNIKVFHQEVYQCNATKSFPSDAVILGYEKINRKRLFPENSKMKWSEILDSFNLKYKEELESLNIKYSQKSINGFLKGPKNIILTHAIYFSNREKKLYSLYNMDSLEKTNLIEENLNYYRRLKKEFKNTLNQKKYTHIIIGSTGWNNDQKNSFNRYNEWITSLDATFKKNNEEFTPFFIGVTWPSFWGKKNIFDYFNKANDADELGFIQLNHLLWNILNPLVSSLDDPPKVIVIGHSLGARALSRALYSRNFLDNKSKGFFSVNYFFSLQGAFSMKRYLPLKGGEKGIYAFDSPVENTIVTSSIYDSALPWAFWVSHIGSRRTLKKFNSKNEYSYNKFDVIYAQSNGEINGSCGEKKYKLVIADEFIRNHSDVSDSTTANFIYQFIKEK